MATNLCDLLAEKLLAEHPEWRELLQNLTKGESRNPGILAEPIEPPVLQQVPDAYRKAREAVEGMTPAVLGTIAAEGRSHYDIYSLEFSESGISMEDAGGESSHTPISVGGQAALEYLASISLVARITEMALKNRTFEPANATPPRCYTEAYDVGHGTAGP